MNMANPKPGSSQTASTVSSVEALHLDDVGYGPGGQLTRRVWRLQCLDAISKDRDYFIRWQRTFLENRDRHAYGISFGVRVTYKDGSTVDIYDDLENLLEPTTLDFAGHQFDTAVDASNFQFYIPSTFVAAEFRQTTTFRSSRWDAPVFFDYAHFRLGVWMDSIIFRGNASFQQTTFTVSAEFKHTHFDRAAIFTGSVFSERASFDACEFRGVGVFAEVEFVGTASFQRASFAWSVGFDMARFHKAAFFNDARFQDVASFDRAAFNEDVSFFKAGFSSDAGFRVCTFRGDAEFENAVFDNVGDFEGARFTSRSPSFLAVKQQTTLVFSDASHFPADDVSADAIKRYEVLKQLSEAQGQNEQALEFNALELRVRRLQPGAAYGFRVTTWLYESLSAYGRSFVRPLAFYGLLVGFTFSLALLHAAVHSPPSCPGEPALRIGSDLLRDDHCDSATATSTVHLSGYRAAVEYALYRAAGVLDFADNDKQTEAINRRLFQEAIEPWWMRIYGVFKAISSTALLFLVALGLRNKYRLK